MSSLYAPIYICHIYTSMCVCVVGQMKRNATFFQQLRLPLAGALCQFFHFPWGPFGFCFCLCLIIVAAFHSRAGALRKTLCAIEAFENKSRVRLRQTPLPLPAAAACHVCFLRECVRVCVLLFFSIFFQCFSFIFPKEIHSLRTHGVIVADRVYAAWSPKQNTK